MKKTRLDPTLGDFAAAARAVAEDPQALLNLARDAAAQADSSVERSLKIVAVLRRLGAQEAAYQLCTEFIARHPADIRIALLMAQCLESLERPDAALAACDYALRIRPDDPAALMEKARLLLVQGRNAEAFSLMEPLAGRMPGRADVWALLAAAAFEAGQYDAARIACKSSLALDPVNANALGTFGHILARIGDFAGARAHYQLAAAKDPANARTHYMLGYASLALGDFATGWDGYAARHRIRPAITIDGSMGLPRWSGENLGPGRLLVWAEQGIGEEIMFAGLLPELLAGGVSPVLICDARLVPLFQRSFPGLDARARGGAGDLQHAGLAAQIALADLGGLFRRSEAAFHSARPFLRADPGRVAHFRARYAALAGPGRKLIGIAWRSSNRQVGDHKSGRLDDFLPLLRRSDCLVISLQYGDTIAERTAMQATHGLAPFHDGEVDPLVSLDAQAAQIASLDAVVSTSNSAVHLAGGLGIPGTVLLAPGRGLHWYWAQGEGSSRWYPSLSLRFGVAEVRPSAQLEMRLSNAQVLGLSG